jgi:hypothetical protein
VSKKPVDEILNLYPKVEESIYFLKDILSRKK